MVSTYLLNEWANIYDLGHDVKGIVFFTVSHGNKVLKATAK